MRQLRLTGAQYELVIKNACDRFLTSSRQVGDIECEFLDHRGGGKVCGFSVLNFSCQEIAKSLFAIVCQWRNVQRFIEPVAPVAGCCAIRVFVGSVRLDKWASSLHLRWLSIR